MIKTTLDEIAKNLSLNVSQIMEWEQKYKIEIQKDNNGNKLYSKKEEDIFRKIQFLKSHMNDEDYISKLVLKFTSSEGITYNSMTISDIAKVSGVSLGTVSRVINNRDGKIKISDSTKEKVLTTIKELGYKPNPFASALRSQKSDVIGAVIRDIEDPFLRQIIREIQKVVHMKGLELFIGHAEYELLTAERQLNIMLNHWFDGLIILGNLPGDENIINNLSNPNIPIVKIASGLNADIPSIDFDQYHGSQIALDYLFKLGHRRIAFLGSIKEAGVSERLKVYQDFIEKNKLILSDRYIYTNSDTRGNALIFTRELLKLSEPPTAIFCTSDISALGAMSGAWQMGWQVPKDISIIGYDDIDEAADAYSPLTTIRQPSIDAANMAVDLLLNLIENPNNTEISNEISIKPELIIRESCSVPRNNS